MTRDELIAHLADSAGVDESQIAEDTLLFSSGLIDSIAMVDLIVFLESAAGLKVGVADMRLENLDSVGRILAFVGKAKMCGTEARP